MEMVGASHGLAKTGILPEDYSFEEHLQVTVTLTSPPSCVVLSATKCSLNCWH